MRKERLNAAIVAFQKHRKNDNLSKGATKADEWVLLKLLDSAGNILTTSLNGDHVDEFLDILWTTNSARSMANYFYIVKNFFGWLHETERIRRNPMARRKPPKFAIKERRRVPAEQFAELLDQARNPIDRMVMASGVLLLARDTEISGIRIGDLLWDIRRVRTGLAKVTSRNQRSSDDMPMTLEYQRELDRFLAWYEDQCGPLQPHWYLHPALTKPAWKPNPNGPGSVWFQEVEPTRRGGKHNEMVQECLEAIGFPTRDEETGKSLYEGMHTLRRSGARARFNELRVLGYDGALREVQMLLHHVNASQTETYIGIDLDILKRDEALIDQWMYPSLAPAEGATPVDLAKYLPGTATAPNPDDVIQLASRRKFVLHGDEELVSFPGGWTKDGTPRNKTEKTPWTVVKGGA